MVSSKEIIRRCTIAKQTTDLCTSPLTQMLAAEYLASNRYSAAVHRARTEYQRRMRAMVDALNQELPGQLRFVVPKGGMFIWVESVGTLDPKALFQAAVDQGVLYVPGSAFYPVDPNPNTMRLSYAAPNVEEIREGIARLGRAFRITVN
jgi:DNA-binding transcriptional MocR family regulator